MQPNPTRFCLLTIFISVASMLAADWTQFRGPGGLGVSAEKGLPAEWSSTKNIAWQTALPGPGASSPITLGDRVFVTCYSGYGLEPNKGDQADLVRHVLCFNRKTGKAIWHKKIEPKLPEHNYRGEGSYQGYAGSTPTTDGQRLYVFFGKSGVFCFDLNGRQLWRADVGGGLSGWGSGCSPLLHGDLLIVNASVESGSLIALNKLTGKEVWRAKGIGSSWNTLGVKRYVCPSVVAHKTIVYCLGGGHTSLAVRTGGRGDVTESHGVWRLSTGSNVSSPVYYQGHLYWTRDGSTVCCQNPATGKFVYRERLKPGPGRIWSSPVLADGKLYFVSQHKGTYVVAAKPKFELLAHNVFAADDSRANASSAISNGQLLLRTDRNLYCIGGK